MAPQSEMASIPNVNTYSGCGRNWFSMKSICAVICMSFSFFSFFALGWLVWCNCTTRWKPSVQLCAHSVRRFHSEYFMPRACNLFCLPYCYISPQWWQAGLWSAITLKNNRIKGQPSPSLSRTMQYRSWDEPRSSCTLAYWLKYLLDVPLLTCNLLLAAAEREPDDKSSLRPSVFYGFHVLTVKLCLSVPSALRLNVKEPSMEGSLRGQPYVCRCPAADRDMKCVEPTEAK